MAPWISAHIKCEWAFKCPKEWETLAPTALPNVRYCGTCQKDVTLALGRAHLDALTEAGACVAVVWGRRSENVNAPVLRMGLRHRADPWVPFTDEL